MSKELTPREKRLRFIIGLLIGVWAVTIILYITPVSPIHCYINHSLIHGNLILHVNHVGAIGNIHLSCP